MMIEYISHLRTPYDHQDTNSVAFGWINGHQDALSQATNRREASGPAQAQLRLIAENRHAVIPAVDITKHASTAPIIEKAG